MEYLGDGVTASFDGFQIELSTQRGDRTERVYLDPNTYAALVRFAETNGFGR